MAIRMLVVVDVQNDFLKGGALAYGYPERSNTSDLIAYVKEWRRSDPCRERTIIVGTMDTHDEHYKESLEGRNLPISHCIKNTPGWRFPDNEQGYLNDFLDKVILKPTFGTFRIAELVREIEAERCEKVTEIFLCGYDLSICVLANAVLLRAAFPDKVISVKASLCGDVDEESYKAAVKVLRNQQILVV